MFTMKILLFIAFISFSTSFCQQVVFEDILLFKKDVVIPEYPYKGRYDSLKEENDKKLREFLSKYPPGFFTIDTYTPLPYVYAETEENKESPFTEYSELVRDLVPKEYWVQVRYTIEWTGLISEAYIISYKGKKPDIDFIRSIVSKLRGKPAESGYGFPTPGPFGHTWVIEGRK